MCKLRQSLKKIHVKFVSDMPEFTPFKGLYVKFVSDLPELKMLKLETNPLSNAFLVINLWIFQILMSQ